MAQHTGFFSNLLDNIGDIGLGDLAGAGLS
jgi:hypothetical protein